MRVNVHVNVMAWLDTIDLSSTCDVVSFKIVKHVSTCEGMVMIEFNF